MAEVGDPTVAAVFMEAEGLAEAGGRIAVAAGIAAELGVRMAAGCNAAAREDTAGIRLADIADMGEQDMAEGSAVGLALQAERLAVMLRDFPTCDRR